MEDNLTYSEEQRHLYKDKLDDLNAEKQARLEILSQNRIDLQMEVARIKHIKEKVLDKDMYLAEKIVPYFESRVLPVFVCRGMRLHAHTPAHSKINLRRQKFV